MPNSNIVETNALYEGGRDTTEKHRATIALNGWDFCPVDIMDEEGTVMLPAAASTLKKCPWAGISLITIP